MTVECSSYKAENEEVNDFFEYVDAQGNHNFGDLLARRMYVNVYAQDKSDVEEVVADRFRMWARLLGHG